MPDPQTFQRLGFRKCLTTSDTAVTLDGAVAVLKTTETLGFALAAMASHLTFMARHMLIVYRKIQQLSASYAFCCGLAWCISTAGLFVS